MYTPLNNDILYFNTSISVSYTHLDKYNSISIIGDKGYINKRLTPELKTEKDINLLFL